MTTINGRKYVKYYTFEAFVAKANDVHDNRFEYIEIKSTPDRNNKLIRRVKFRCKNCKKIITQKLTDHLRGHGCKCSGSKSSKHKYSLRGFTDQQVFDVLNKIHNDRYQYKKKYIFNNVKYIEYVCKECESYVKQRLYVHLRGSGCSVCAHKRVAQKATAPDDVVFKKANEIHNNRYIYLKLKTSECNGNRRIVYKCTYCGGITEQYLFNHLRGHGCRNCYLNDKSRIYEEDVVCELARM